MSAPSRLRFNRRAAVCLGSFLQEVSSILVYAHPWKPTDSRGTGFYSHHRDPKTLPTGLNCIHWTRMSTWGQVVRKKAQSCPPLHQCLLIDFGGTSCGLGRFLRLAKLHPKSQDFLYGSSKSDDEQTKREESSPKVQGGALTSPQFS